ncbi:MAG: lipoyl(octanoyl) transferase LipB [Bacteroidales bacterium]|nr:lipoyl(octanoyl) transferase LipB [Bacteroidales bacterium]
MNFVEFIDIGLINYKQAYEFQEKLHKQVLSESNTNFVGYFILCEHTHVYTLGKNGNINNLLVNNSFLKKIGAEFFCTNRGGDITYHGPGQIVGYPILNIKKLGLSVKNFVYLIEELIIKVLMCYNIKASRIPKAVGVWIDADTPSKQRKICAIGIRISQGVTMHGFAFNVNTDLKYFDYINPCGFKDKLVTSLQKEVNNYINIEDVKLKVKELFAQVFCVKYGNTNKKILEN